MGTAASRLRDDLRALLESALSLQEVGTYITDTPLKGALDFALNKGWLVSAGASDGIPEYRITSRGIGALGALDVLDSSELRGGGADHRPIPVIP